MSSWMRAGIADCCELHRACTNYTSRGRRGEEMTIADLRRAIADIPEDRLVILQKASHDEPYSQVERVIVENLAFVPEPKMASGWIYPIEVTTALKARGYSDAEKAPAGALPCVLIVPT
jgi:hypothetical protein